MKAITAAVAVLALAAWLRGSGLDWDGGALLHPDERFLAMLAADARLPGDLATHLDAQRSTLNPRNLGRDFYVYGTLPIALVKIAAAPGPREGPVAIAATGRTLAAALDVATAALVWLLASGLARAQRLDASVATWATLAYALAVLAIQQAHFFTVDVFLACFGTAAVVAALQFRRSRSPFALVAAALAFGLALATKISAALYAPLLVALVGFAQQPPRSRTAAMRSAALAVAAFAAISYAMLRLADPSLFGSASLLDPRPDPRWLANLALLRASSQSDVFYPPGVQWIDRTPVWFALRNLALFGLGLPLFGLALVGAWRLAGVRAFEARVLVAWVVAVFAFQSLQFVQAMRYLYPLVPFLALFAGCGAAAIVARARTPRIRVATSAALALLLAAWPASFVAIYARPHSRVTASAWLHANVPAGAVIATEHWDDALPLPIPNRTPRHSMVTLPVFDPDTPEKWQTMDAMLARADVLVLSSNRGYGSIGRVPERYPRMAAFYADLFAGRTDFERVASFSSFPTLFGIAIDDRSAEEAFTVYDHPEVLVFRRKSR